jgi:hypothetical protein
MECRKYTEGDLVNINHYRERKAGSTTYYVVKIIKILPDGFMNVEYNSRHGEFHKIHKNDILKKPTRVCTMEVSYKENQINVRPKTKFERHVFLCEELWVENEVVDSRMGGERVEFLMKWEKQPSTNWWQRRNMLPPNVVEEGDALIERKARERKRATTERTRARIKQKRAIRVRKVKKETEMNIKKQEDTYSF